MTVLLVSLRIDRPGHVAGEVVTVLAGLPQIGALDRQEYLVLDVSGITQAEAQATYLAPGIGKARARILDVAQVPTQAKNRIAAKLAKAAEKRVAAEAEGRLRFMAFIRQKFGPLTAEEEARSQHEWLELLARRWARAKAEGASEAVLGRLDAIADRLRKEARDGERAVLDPELALLPNANVLNLTATQLANATVEQ